MAGLEGRRVLLVDDNSTNRWIFREVIEAAEMSVVDVAGFRSAQAALESDRFDLVLLAAQRARQISSGAELTIDRDNDKNPVVALREIADETFTPDELREFAVSNLQTHVDVDEPEEVDAAILNAGNEAPATDAPVEA